jgi:hypothetical protein
VKPFKYIRHIVKNKYAYRVRLRAMKAIWLGRPTLYGAQVNLPTTQPAIITFMTLYGNAFTHKNDDPFSISGKSVLD